VSPACWRALGISAGCSDRFEGCIASRTCPPEGGESGAATAGQAGEATAGGPGPGTNTGGSGDGRGGSAGLDSAGGEAGAGGMAGAGEDSARPTIVSVAPGDGDENVERDIAVTITFSEPIDERSITETSILLAGPEGDVVGTLRVDGNVVSFLPSRKLWLLGDYSLTVGETVADLSGNTLHEGTRVGFRIRDGRWSEPKWPFGANAPMGVSQFQRNALGDIVLGMVSATPNVLYGATYRAAEDEWSGAAELKRDAYFPIFGVGIDIAGRAVASWSDSVTHGWLRTTGGADWGDAGALGEFANVTVSSTGLATAAWWRAGYAGIETRTMDLRNGSLKPPQTIDITGPGIGPYPVASRDRTAILARTTSPSDGDVLWISWEDGAEWSQPEPIASAPLIFDFAYDSDEHGNIIVVWPENDRVWSRIYARSSDSWGEEQFVAAASSNANVQRVDMTNGSALLSFGSREPTPSTWAMIYDAGQGWVESSLVSLDEQQSSDAGIALDDAGNGIAIYAPAGLGSRIRRYVAGVGWQPHVPPPLAIAGATCAAAFDRSITVVTSTATGNPAPRTIRFE
jgi:hypothetical protein